MRKVGSVVAFATVGLLAVTTASALTPARLPASDLVITVAKCPAGKITCSQWCRKYRPHAMANCMGPGNGCAGKPQGGATCVGDACNPSNDSCSRMR
jgi:hypothetical protein